MILYILLKELEVNLEKVLKNQHTKVLGSILGRRAILKVQNGIRGQKKVLDVNQVDNNKNYIITNNNYIN